jgi:hypothetical protein
MKRTFGVDSRKPERPRTWIQDPELARTIFCALPQPYDLIFLIGYTSGLQPGETCGLRLSDCAWLDESDPEARVLRVRYNRLGPLKEDKCTDGAAKVKWAPTSDDEIALILAHSCYAPTPARAAVGRLFDNRGWLRFVI